MTHPLTPREKVALKPCPFCGGEVFADQEKSSFIIGCFRTKCGMEPYCTGDDLNEVANQWNRRTALASGSGEHAELARLADMADWMADGDPGANGSVLLSASVASEHASDLKALLAENAALRAEVSQANANGASHWSRATEAERKLAEAEGRQLPDISTDGPNEIDDHRYWLARQLLDSKLTADEAYSIVRHFPGISKEAERG